MYIDLILNSPSSSFSSQINFISGASAGCISVLLTHPFDVLKTKQQVPVPGVKISTIITPLSPSSSSSSLMTRDVASVIQSSNSPYPTVVHTNTTTITTTTLPRPSPSPSPSLNRSSVAYRYSLKSIYREGGVQGLYRGAVTFYLIIIHVCNVCSMYYIIIVYK